MKKQFILILVLLVLIGVAIGFLLNGCSSGISQENNQQTFDKEVQSVVEEMTLREKVGQMTQITLEVIVKKDGDGNIIRPLEIDETALKEALVDYKVGSVINTGGAANSLETWQAVITAIQHTATEKTRLQIPVLYGIDAIHGTNYTKGATLFPQQLAQAATFNPDIVRDAARMTAYETRASGIPWTFSPVLGMGTQPLWPRFWETFGEDTFLATQLGEAMVQGYQGTDISDTTRVAACMKHYMGYSHPHTGKDRTPARIPERTLRQYYLPPFAKAVESGVITTMINSGEINGIPVHSDKHILKDILKEELDFKGFAVTDWQDIIYLHTRHKIAPTMRDAVRMAINAGIDMSMVPFKYKEFSDILVELVESGEVSENRIDDAVSRIIYVKKKLGLWENPVTHYKGYEKFASEEFQKRNLESAEESVVMLANRNNTLPLDSDARILVTGPTANSMVPLNGGWSYTWQGDQADKFAGDKNTVLEAIQQTFAASDYVKGVDYHKVLNIDKALEAAGSADAVILCLGESSYCETPGNIEKLDIPKAQEELASAMAKTGKPVILVLLEGRPRVINTFADDMDAILLGNLLGNQGGNALANVISGKVNPSGKLPYTYPGYSNHLVRYNHKGTQALNKEGNGTPEFDPQFEFGYGLSYTSFEYQNLQLSDDSLLKGEELIVTVDVKNTGDRKGKESVLLYITDHYASITPAVKELRGFNKIELAPGDSREVEFAINEGDLSFIGRNMKPVVEKGAFTVTIDTLQKDFQWK